MKIFVAISSHKKYNFYKTIYKWKERFKEHMTDKKVLTIHFCAPKIISEKQLQAEKKARHWIIAILIAPILILLITNIYFDTIYQYFAQIIEPYKYTIFDIMAVPYVLLILYLMADFMGRIFRRDFWNLHESNSSTRYSNFPLELWFDNDYLHIKYTKLTRREPEMANLFNTDKTLRSEEYCYKIQDISTFCKNKSFPDHGIFDIGGKCRCTVIYKHPEFQHLNLYNFETEYVCRVDTRNPETYELFKDIIRWLEHIVGREMEVTTLTYIAGVTNKRPY